MTSCQHCSGPINPNLDFEQIVGYRRHRREGGSNQIHLAEATGRYTCRTCIDLLKAGAHPMQPALWEGSRR